MSWHEAHPPGEPVREPLPRLEDIPTVPHGLDPARVAEAFQRFESRLSHERSRQLPALPEGGRQEARFEALKLIRAAAEFADVLERDAQQVAARQMSHVHRELDQREDELRTRESALLAQKDELERRRSEILASAERQADEIVASAQRAAVEARHEAELAKLRVLEDARAHIGELTAATRAEVEHTLEWSRAQAEGIVNRARSVAEQLLTASLRGQHAVVQVVDAIVRSTEAELGPAPSSLTTARPPELEAPPFEPHPQPAAAPQHEPEQVDDADWAPVEPVPPPAGSDAREPDEPTWPWERTAPAPPPGAPLADEPWGHPSPPDAAPGWLHGDPDPEPPAAVVDPGLGVEPEAPPLREPAAPPRRFAWPLGGDRGESSE